MHTHCDSTVQLEKDLTMTCSFISLSLLQGFFFCVMALTGTEKSPRSAFVITRENKKLVGHAVKKFNPSSILTCSHSCLQNSWCASTNFKKYSKGEENGICELNKHKNISFEDIKLVDQLESTFSMLFKVIMNTSHSLLLTQ